MTACKCGHVSLHHLERPCTGSPVCGCREYRPDDGQRWTPARFDERYDPSPYGIQRRTA